MTMHNTTAIVTGATRGIGRAIAECIARAGGSVIGTGTRDVIPAAPEGVRFVALDLASEESMQRFIRDVVAPLPRIDILVNNAGISAVAPIDTVPDADWARILHVNLTGAMQLIRAVIPTMRAQRYGRVLNVSSMFGIVAKEGRSAYAASKAGLIGLTRACALDVARDAILVNALCPGVTMTDLTASILSSPQALADLVGQIPLGRCAEPDEIARAAFFLVSRENTYITGQAIVIDGGFTAR